MLCTPAIARQPPQQHEGHRLVSSMCAAYKVLSAFTGLVRGTVSLTSAVCPLRLGFQAKKQLGWEPKVPLREGLSRMVSDFAKRLDVPGRPA